MTKIMLVEDDNNLREIYEARLAAEGFEIVSAQDGEAALAIAGKEKPDMIISDVMMPKISGFEMLDILRNTDSLRNVKIIMLTALGQAEDNQRANSLGADRYLVKSQVTLEDIVKAAHELLGTQSANPPAGSDDNDDSSAGDANNALQADATPDASAPAEPADQPAPAADTPVADPPAAEPPVQPEPSLAPEAIAPEPAAAEAAPVVAPEAVAEPTPEPAAPEVDPDAAPKPSVTIPITDASDDTQDDGAAAQSPLPTPEPEAAEPAESAPEPTKITVVEPPAELAVTPAESPVNADIPVAGPASAPAAETPADGQPGAADNPVEAPGDTQVTSDPSPLDMPAEPASGPTETPSVTTSEEGVAHAEPQAAASEEEAIRSQIDDFINQQKDAAPEAPAETAAPETKPAASDAPSTEGSAGTSATATTAPVSVTAQPQALQQDFEPEAEELGASQGPTITPQNAPAEATSEESAQAGSAGSSKKVIAPLADGTKQPDINQLLALEEAKNSALQAAASAPAAATPNVAAYTGTSPQTQPVQAAPTEEIDPNSIAL